MNSIFKVFVYIICIILHHSSYYSCLVVHVKDQVINFILINKYKYLPKI